MGDSRIITGPPASGKSRAALDRFLSLPDSALITPSATMAEHVRNELARAGVRVRPGRVTTLAQFLETWTPLAPATEALLHLLIQQALEKLRPPRFAAVAGFPGFHRAVAALMEEAPPDALSGPFAQDLDGLFRAVEAGLAIRGMALRHKRLRSSGAGAWPAHVVFDGFFSFSPAELDLIATIASRSAVTLTLPDWPGAVIARERLLCAGFTEHRHIQVSRRPRLNGFSTPTLEGETEEIARRILEFAANGRAFREMGIILRARDPYAPALETTLARLGIPARFYFSDPLADHPAVSFLSGVVRALIDGWDHAALLRLVRMPVSGVGATPAGDRFDFALRERLPGAGLPLSDAPELVASLAGLDPWRRDRMDPRGWATRLKALRSLLPEPAVTDRTTHQQVHIWRSTATALEAFATVVDATAAALAGAAPMPLAQFWRQAEVALALDPLRVADRRRNVVHVMDVFEARQWELPIVFVCGLMERHFPQYHREDPLLNDAARRRAGLKTSLDRQAEERFLFEFAISRSTEEAILSHARFDEKGEETLPSFFLDGVETIPCETRVRPKPVREPSPPSRSVIQDAALRDRLAHLHQTLAPTSIESFLQCPFQFFAAKTLRLRPRPPAPRDRLDLLVQGSILHQALASGDFDRVFADVMRRARIPATYRTEAVRLELLRHFEAFLADHQVKLGWASRVEEPFRLPLSPLVTITGRIDRLEIGPQNQALVIDYKYSAGNKIRERIEEHASGNLVQAGLYLLAAERQFGLAPAGMLYCGLRKEVVWDGWHEPIPGLEKIGETRATLRELMDTAAAKAIESFEAITGGSTAPQPADPRKCLWCDFRDMCRVETAGAALRAGSG